MGWRKPVLRSAATLRLADSPALRREAEQPNPENTKKENKHLTNLSQDLTQQVVTIVTL